MLDLRAAIKRRIARSATCIHVAYLGHSWRWRSLPSCLLLPPREQSKSGKAARPGPSTIPEPLASIFFPKATVVLTRRSVEGLYSSPNPEPWRHVLATHVSHDLCIASTKPYNSSKTCTLCQTEVYNTVMYCSSSIVYSSTYYGTCMKYVLYRAIGLASGQWPACEVIYSIWWINNEWQSGTLIYTTPY